MSLRRLPTERRTGRYGWRPDTPDPRDRVFNLEHVVHRAHQLPPSHRLTLPNPALNQQALGACVGNGTAGALMFDQHAEKQPVDCPSRLFIYWCARSIEGTTQTDSGAQIRDAIKVVATTGAPPETLWPYSDENPGPFQERPPLDAFRAAGEHRAIAYHRVLLGGPGDPLRSALLSRPVVFGFMVPARFEDGTWDPARQVLAAPTQGDQWIGGHCVLAHGWDYTRTRFPVDALLVRNSWGTEWGAAGDFWMDAAWFQPHGAVSDLWTITTIS